MAKRRRSRRRGLQHVAATVQVAGEAAVVKATVTAAAALYFVFFCIFSFLKDKPGR